MALLDGLERGQMCERAAYALPYQPMSARELNWSVILGMAVATIVWS